MPVAAELALFQTDLCTAYREGTIKEPMKWAHCCLKHDLEYWVAGTKEDQKASDLRLKACVKESGSPIHARLIYTGVVSGHLSPIKHKTHWGWGYLESERDDFSPLTEDEKIHARNRLLDLDIDPQLIQRVIKDLSL